MAEKSGINPMKELLIDKLVVNMGTGSEINVNNSAKRLLELVTGHKPVAAASKKRNPAFKITKGQTVGAFVTLRGPEAKTLVTKLFSAVDNTLKETSVTNNSVSFGIREYIDISGIKYDPKIGMLGMNINLAFRRRGASIELRKRRRAKIPNRHKTVTREEIKAYLKKEFSVGVGTA